MYIDRYYTSPELAMELIDMNYHLTCTVMTRKIGLPPTTKQLQKQMKKDYVTSQRKDSFFLKGKQVVTKLA